ncbi:hypothetical protein NQ314_006073 [Rhamnusium bicolor]|uniref:Rab proteins geranylgeranyltransferase component A n=1 Tax=Rhamnusium bicolor TaxID=1586634 RepID=A0AAV8Z7Z7_9CUCU|nr:hypothetical protein NQ314_006073 [Rhamnusium bicolor]
MENQLPNDFDLIIIGTGVVESIVSAAASRIGKTVLHIDRNDYYGGHWASFNLDAIQKLQHKATYNSISQDNLNELINENEELMRIGNDLFNIENFKFKWHIPEKRIIVSDDNKNRETKVDEGTLSTEIENEIGEQVNKSTEEEEDWTQEILNKDSRKFNIDLTPKLQYARGDFVELLISSNIARYSEYRSVSRVLTLLNGQLEVVPCSRSDVFANSKVSVIEKRMLMKLLTSLDDGSEDFKNYENKTFRAFLKDKKLTPNLVHYVLYAISMSTDETPCHEGVENTKRFLNSLGRFGKTPFLFSMYGSGEITQAFL